MKIKFFTFLLMNILGMILAYENETRIDYKAEKDTSSKVLSRRKRFIIFPDGSSFQLVFCAQNQGYIQVGDIIWFGNTAALAWELPNDPEIFNTLRGYSKDFNSLRRHDVSKHIYYLDENGKVLSKVPYKKRLIVNPAFAKRSTDNLKTMNDASRREMHERQKNSSVFLGLHENRILYHRETRKTLYEKFEKFFQGFGWNGRECVLRMLCETGKGSTEQGTFLEEIVKATFTFPKHQKVDDSNSKYDEAHRSTGHCAKLYPECSNLYLQ
ncbi:hypothetical protein K1T71_009140 [Dendrolimus kikuchii]|uniref:Uncharacterized protein n=1 Tax=Dendrolimus kikuchii TaxID=765133 RepID=A0ACC1CU95_9NEOP|nr:hypothetical protein K1T71_009140 [Dendrolimus kikuchii]